MSDSYTVQFRLYGVELVPDLLTELFKVQPVNIQRIGERSGSSTFTKNMWGIERRTESGGLFDWPTLREGIEDIMEVIVPFKDKIMSLEGSIQRVLWCGQYHDSFSMGPILDIATLREVVGLNAEINISTFCQHGDENES